MFRSIFKRAKLFFTHNYFVDHRIDTRIVFYLKIQMYILILLVYIQLIIYIITACIAFLYLCLILFIRRFHNTNNTFIANICLSIIVSAVYFIVYFQDISIYGSSLFCSLFYLAFNIACISIPYSFLALTVHRFCIIIYPQNRLFKKKQWTPICIISHWIFQFLISTAFFGEYDYYCEMKIFMGYYTFITAVMMPLVIKSALDIRIFIHVRHSTHRIRIQAFTVSNTGSTHNNQLKITRRDISVLKHTIFTFLVFIIGWTPVLLMNLIDSITPGHIVEIIACMYVSACCTFIIIIYLFVCNRDVRQHLFNPLRRCFQH